MQQGADKMCPLLVLDVPAAVRRFEAAAASISSGFAGWLAFRHPGEDVEQAHIGDVPGAAGSGLQALEMVALGA